MSEREKVESVEGDHPGLTIVIQREIINNLIGYLREANYRLQDPDIALVIEHYARYVKEGKI